jgi:hypothetical protein
VWSNSNRKCEVRKLRSAESAQSAVLAPAEKYVLLKPDSSVVFLTILNSRLDFHSSLYESSGHIYKALATGQATDLRGRKVARASWMAPGP